MVNTLSKTRPVDLRRTRSLVSAYVVVALATIGVLALLSAVGSGQATGAAWWHAAIVGGFAVLLPLRLRAARRGSEGGIRAVAIIATVLLLVNLVEAAIPGLFPIWMRVEMVGIAVLMAAVVGSVVRARR